MSEKTTEHSDVLEAQSIKEEVVVSAISELPTQSRELVDFDGPEDPANPLNKSTAAKWTIVALISATTFATGFATMSVTPAAPQIASDLHSTNNGYVTILLVSIWELGEAVAPLLMAPLAETYGRVPVYHTANLLFIVASICGALSVNLGMLVAFRFLNGVAVGAVTLNAAIIGDMFVQEERGAPLAAETIPLIFASVVGPVVGGYLSQASGWRWCFWLNAIIVGVLELGLMIWFRHETYKVVILRRKAARLRRETGDETMRCAYDGEISPGVFRDPALLRRAVFQPLLMLIESWMLLLLAMYGAVVYAYMVLMSTTMSTLFEHKYGFSEGSAGLAFLGPGVGTIIGAFVCAVTLDPYLKRISAKNGGEMKPEYRLPPMVIGGFFIPAGFFLYGWTSRFHVHWIAPIVGTGLIGVGMILTIISLTNYLVDAFQVHAASGMAVVIVMRCIVGSLFPLAAVPLYSNLGYGWGNSVLGFIALAFIPVPILFLKYGERIRKGSKFVVVS